MLQMKLEGKNAIITGCRRGIGRAIVQKFAENGCNIWACARTPDPAFEQDMAGIAAVNGIWIRPVYFELTDPDQIKEGIRTVFAERKPLDILVNAAGICELGLFQMTPMDRIRTMFEVNLFSVMELTQYALKGMLRAKKGVVVNIASIAGLDVGPAICSYGTSKAALIHFTKNLASETGRQGIRVNAVAPGPADTDMVQIVRDKVGENLLLHAAMERLAKPEEIADAVLFLASDDASFINGQVLRVDGGSK